MYFSWKMYPNQSFYCNNTALKLFKNFKKCFKNFIEKCSKIYLMKNESKAKFMIKFNQNALIFCWFSDVLLWFICLQKIKFQKWYHTVSEICFWRFGRSIPLNSRTYDDSDFFGSSVKIRTLRNTIWWRPRAFSRMYDVDWKVFHVEFEKVIELFFTFHTAQNVQFRFFFVHNHTVTST